MTLYLSANNKMPLIEWDTNSPAFNAKELEESESHVRNYFSLSDVFCVGSDQGCGCGFRHALLWDGEWLNVMDEESNNEQKNHVALLEYVSTYVEDGMVEIYACWNGDVNDLPISKEEINADDLINKDFYFKERGFYQIKIK
jgi:hypothetical protein